MHNTTIIITTTTTINHNNSTHLFRIEAIKSSMSCVRGECTASKTRVSARKND